MGEWNNLCDDTVNVNTIQSSKIVYDWKESSRNEATEVENFLLVLNK